MADHLHHPASVGDLAVSTMRVKWLPPFDLLRVASVDNDGWATSFRALDGTNQRARGPYQTVFLVSLTPEQLAPARTIVRCAASIGDLKDALVAAFGLCEHGTPDPENPHDPCMMCAVAP